MKLVEFVSESPNGETCMNNVKALKEDQGIKCPSCGHLIRSWLVHSILCIVVA